ncbi:MAG: aldo/keto reductase [Vicinamibacterales bacterium]
MRIHHMQPFALAPLGVSAGGGAAASGSPQAILGLAGLRSPLWGEPPDDYAEFASLDLAYREGYRFFDTAAIYGLGGCERTLGRWTERRGNRRELVVVGKGGHPSLVRPGRHRLTPEALDHDLRGSLDRLRTDYLDVYALHRDGQSCDLTAVMRYLHEQVTRGTIRAIGVSNWTHTRIDEANTLARQLGLTPFAVSSPQLSLLTWTSAPWRGCVSVSGAEGAAARAWYRDSGMPVLAWSPFGGGLTRGADGAWKPSGKHYAGPGNAARLARAAAIAQQRDLTVPQILMAYLASLPLLVHPICASRNQEHLRANREALQVRLSEADVHFLENG